MQERRRRATRGRRLVLIGGLGLLGSLFGLGALAQRGGEPPKGPLTREAAVKMVKAFLAAYKLPDSPGLNEKNLGGADIGGHRVFFEYVPDRKALRSYATVYCFRKPPKPGVLEGFKREEQAGTDTGGGTVEYVSESRCLMLARTHTQAADGAQFTRETQRLLAASKMWSEQVVGRVATRVFHPEDIK